MENIPYEKRSKFGSPGELFNASSPDIYDFELDEENKENAVLLREPVSIFATPTPRDSVVFHFPENPSPLKEVIFSNLCFFTFFCLFHFFYF